jgi:hypothetical protein
MALDIIKQLQESLAQDLVKFERSVDYDTLGEQDLEIIEKTYEEIYKLLHDINVNIQ